ncbi:hypothetical protein VNO77_01271 [Canavalia gladiata]|uniref:Uncharacterized protein n=1 Tax=Canavalia gladiata TaxID=3824 RepID=A0AAN9R545_CANGL
MWDCWTRGSVFERELVEGPSVAAFADWELGISFGVKGRVPVKQSFFLALCGRCGLLVSDERVFFIVCGHE